MPQEMTADEALDKLRSLPEEKQRIVLQRLSPDMRSDILNKLQPPTAPPTRQSLLQKFESEIAPGQESGWLQRGKEALKGLVAGPESLIAHPLQSLESMATPIVASGMAPEGYPTQGPSYPSRISQQQQQASAEATKQAERTMAQQGEMLRHHPAYTLGSLIGQAALTHGVGKGIEALRAPKTVPVEVPPETAGVREEPSAPKPKIELPKRGKLLKAAQTVTGTGPEMVKESAKKAVGEYEQGSKAAKTQREELEGIRNQRRVAESELKQKTAKLEKHRQQVQVKAKAENDANWNAVREAIGNEPAPLDKVAKVIKDQESKMDPGTQAQFRQILREASPPEDVQRLRQEVMSSSQGIPTGVPYEKLPEDLKAVIDDVVQRQAAIEGVDIDKETTAPFTRLQGWNTELGQKQFRSGGNLPGNIYSAIDAVRKAVKSTINDLAEEHGATNLLEDARESNTRYQRAFGNEIPERAGKSAAGKAVKAANPQEAARKAQTARVSRVAAYDPTFAQSVKDVEDLHGRLQQIPTEEQLAKRVKAPPERPEINIQEMKQNQLDALSKRWGTWTPWDVRRIAVSSIGGLISALAGVERGELIGSLWTAGEMAPKVLAKVIDKPAVAKWLTTPTADDFIALNKIPGADAVRVKDALAGIAIDSSKPGKPIALDPRVAQFLGPERIAQIAAASSGLPKRQDLLKRKGK